MSPSVISQSTYIYLLIIHLLIYVLFFVLLLELFTNLATEVKQMKDSISYVQSLTSNKMVGYTVVHSLQTLHCKPFRLIELFSLFFTDEGDYTSILKKLITSGGKRYFALMQT